MKPAQLTQTISDTMDDLRKSERKVAEFVLKEPLGVIRMRIVDLAQQAGVSEPTVVRFCRAVGCHGFQDSAPAPVHCSVLVEDGLLMDEWGTPKLELKPKLQSA